MSKLMRSYGLYHGRQSRGLLVAVLPPSLGRHRGLHPGCVRPVRRARRLTSERCGSGVCGVARARARACACVYVSSTAFGHRSLVKFTRRPTGRYPSIAYARPREAVGSPASPPDRLLVDSDIQLMTIAGSGSSVLLPLPP